MFTYAQRGNVMKIMKLICLCALSLSLFTGCSTSHIAKSPTSDLKFVASNVVVNVQGSGIDTGVIDQLSREIKAQLLIGGFSIDDSASLSGSRTLQLNVNVTAFNPGNAALRITVGFGAGRGSLLYRATYKNCDGVVVAEMDGQERFTGMEVGFNNNYGGAATMGGADTATKVLLKEAANHIYELTKRT